MRGLAVIFVACSAACASSPGRQLDEERIVVAPPPDANEPIRQRARPEPDAHARELKDDIDCVKAVRVLELDGEREAAWALVLACARQGKWRDLRKLATAPEMEVMREEDAVELLANIVAVRGGQFELDLPELQRSRFRLYALDDVRSASKLPPRSWIVFRGKVEADASDKKGRRKLEIAELGRVTTDRSKVKAAYQSGGGTAQEVQLGDMRHLGDRRVKVGSDELFRPTGTTIAADTVRELPPLVHGNSYIMLARFEAVLGAEERRRYHETEATTDGDPDRDVIRAQVFKVFKPGTTGPN